MNRKRLLTATSAMGAIFLMCAVVLGAPAVAQESSRTLYVAPNGDDSNSGRIDAPLATFEGARDKVRTLRGPGDITVYFRDGYYPFEAPVRLGFEDSGAEDRTITYAANPGESPVFTSGVAVKGWSKLDADDPFYAALPEAARGETYVADVPKAIVDYPEKRGMFRILIDRKQDWLKRGTVSVAGKIRTSEESEWTGSVEAAIYLPPDMKKSSELSVDLNQWAMPARGMELYTWLSDWNIGLSPIESIESLENGCRVKTSVAATYIMAGGARRYHENINFIDSAVINCPEGIDAPGTWVVNPETARVYLWPFKGTNLEKDIYAPTLNELVSVHGDMPEGSDAWLSDEPVNPTRNITFDGITFTETDFLHCKDTDPLVQHGWGTCDKDNALLRFRGVENCVVRNCTFTKSGGVGVRFDLYAKNNAVEDSTLTWLGMEAVHFGGYGAGTRDENGHNRVEGCEIGYPGQIRTDAHAITLWQSGFNDIRKNYIHNTPYTPILIAGPRFRVLLRHIDDSVPWKDDFYMQEGGWPMTRWDEIPEIASFTAAVREVDGKPRFVHEPSPEHPQYPRPLPHAPLDREAAAFRFAQGNKVQFNTLENVSSGAFGEAFYISGTTEPGARNVITDNWICNSKDALSPIIWMLYNDGYGRGIDLHRNVIYNSEVLYTGFFLAYWRSYNGWEWKDWQFEATPPPGPARANVWVDTSSERLASGGVSASIVVGCGEQDEAFHDPRREALWDYRFILDSIEKGKYPYPGGALPGAERVKEIVSKVVEEVRPPRRRRGG